jgi:hypothetical protein
MTDAALLIIVAGTVALALAVALGFALGCARRFAKLDFCTFRRKTVKTPACLRKAALTSPRQHMASHPPIRPP